MLTTVSVSSNGGRTWAGAYVGPASGSVALPRGMFASSKKSLVKITVTDGFNRTVAVSAPFKALGTPPSVAITTPKSGMQVAAGSPVSLTAQAFDDAGKVISDDRATWFAGKKKIGTGLKLTYKPAKAGKVTLRLVVRDAKRRSSSATTKLKIVKVKR
jgi:hypothetical protein